MRGWSITILGMALCGPGVLHAQGDCFPASDSHEAQTFAILSVPLAFSRAGGIGGAGFTIGLEVASIPEVPATTATPTVCRPGNGPLNTDPLPALGRIRLSASFGDWVVDAGWIPPVRISGVKANLIGLGVARQLPVGHHWILLPRVHALLGSLNAPITCDEDALRDPASECFGGTLSDDHWTPGVFGAELTAARTAGVIRPHVGVGYTLLRPRFRVNFTNAQRSTDRRRISVNLSRAAVFAGVSTELTRFRLTLEGYATVGEPIALRLMIRTPLTS